MQDWRDGRLRYLVRFAVGGSGMRMRDELLAASRRVGRRRCSFH